MLCGMGGEACLKSGDLICEEEKSVKGMEGQAYVLCIAGSAGGGR